MLSAHWRQSLLFLVDTLLDYTSQHPLGLWTLDRVSSWGCTAGLHFPESLGGYWTTLPSIPWGLWTGDRVSSSPWMCCWTTLPSILWGIWDHVTILPNQKQVEVMEAGLFPTCTVFPFPGCLGCTWFWSRASCTQVPERLGRKLAVHSAPCPPSSTMTWVRNKPLLCLDRCMFLQLFTIRIRLFQQRKSGEKLEVFLLFWLLLACSWFTILCWFQVYSRVNQLCGYIYPLFLRFISK